MRIKTLLTLVLFVAATFVLTHSSMAQKNIVNPESNRLKQEQVQNKFMPRVQKNNESVITQRRDAIKNKSLIPYASSEASSESNTVLKAVTWYEYDGVLNNPFDSLHYYFKASNYDPEFYKSIILETYYYPIWGTPTFTIIPKFPITSDSISYNMYNNSIDDFFNDYKCVSAFDNNGNTTSNTFYRTDDEINWDIDYRTLYTYDSNNNLTSVIKQNWWGGVWENIEKNVYTYDTQNNVTEHINYYWDYPTSTWEESMREIATYEGNKLSNCIISHWDGSAWENFQRVSNIYEGNLRTEYIQDYWYSSSWDKDSKTVYTYDSQNRLTNERNMTWDGSSYVNNEKIIYQYENGNNTTKIFQNWETGQWKYSLQEIFEYVGSNLKSLTLASWYSSENAFIGEEKLVFELNEEGFPIETYVEGWDGSDWVHYPGSEVLKLYYGEGNVTGLNSINRNESLAIYPNPTSDFINVNLNGQTTQTIRIIDITGKIVFETRSNFNAAEAQIPVSHLQNGVYILQMMSKDSTRSHKFIIRH